MGYLISTLTRRALLGATCLALSACSVVGASTVEEPRYTVVRAEGGIEIRDYPALVVAETVAQGSMEKAEREAFRRLFRYIRGENTGARGIAMTAPVAVSPEGASTDPALVSLGQEATSDWRMGFVLPASFSLENAPQPLDPLVTLSEHPANRVASVRFSGWWSEDNLEEHRKELVVWLSTNGIRYDPTSIRAAGYNPPWTIPFLRRNEILVNLE